jgi:hypothetical protein
MMAELSHRSTRQATSCCPNTAGTSASLDAAGHGISRGEGNDDEIRGHKAKQAEDE